MPDGPDELAELERRRVGLYREVARVGDFRRGSLNEVCRKCGKPNCAALSSPAASRLAWRRTYTP